MSESHVLQSACTTRITVEHDDGFVREARTYRITAEGERFLGRFAEGLLAGVSIPDRGVYRLLDFLSDYHDGEDDGNASV